ncbi:MAG: hypothetical protein KGR98_11735, partial [Verrucomicrobia bacterium]|nr:hypothetical protein [Verrucomicrobiota bacterium]
TLASVLCQGLVHAVTRPSLDFFQRQRLTEAVAIASNSLEKLFLRRIFSLTGMVPIGVAL